MANAKDSVNIVDDCLFLTIVSDIEKQIPATCRIYLGIIQIAKNSDGTFLVHVHGMTESVKFGHPDHVALYITGIVRGYRVRG